MELIHNMQDKNPNAALATGKISNGMSESRENYAQRKPV